MKKEKINILAVDDDKEFLTLLHDVLKEEGYEISVAESMPDAIKKVKDILFDLIITDKNMPEPKGADLINEIKSISPDSKIIVLTGFGDVESYLELMNLGIYDYLNKPVKMSELKITIKRALNLQNAA
ncbi:MAG: response regulator [Nitrospirae bacterium]|nr:response regulator [Nitrospirota bacterium]